MSRELSSLPPPPPSSSLPQVGFFVSFFIFFSFQLVPRSVPAGSTSWRASVCRCCARRWRSCAWAQQAWTPAAGAARWAWTGASDGAGSRSRAWSLLPPRQPEGNTEEITFSLWDEIKKYCYYYHVILLLFDVVISLNADRICIVLLQKYGKMLGSLLLVRMVGQSLPLFFCLCGLTEQNIVDNNLL